MRYVATALVLTAIAGPAQARAQACQMFAAALGALGATPDSTILVERTAMGVPMFAFHGFSSMRRGDTTLLGTTESALRTINATRVDIPRCMADSLGWKTINDSTLVGFFAARDKGWVAFRAAYPATPRFALMSQPLVSGDTATFYVAVASGELAGQGMLVRIVRSPTGEWIKTSEVVLWVS